jgi:hypothetical protein
MHCSAGNEGEEKLCGACVTVPQGLHRPTIMSIQPVVLAVNIQAPAAALRPYNTCIHSCCCLTRYCIVHALQCPLLEIQAPCCLLYHKDVQAIQTKPNKAPQGGCQLHQQINWPARCQNNTRETTSAQHHPRGTTPPKKLKQVRMYLHAEDRCR